MFTDIEGSTSLWEKYPVGMRSALNRHDEIVRGVIDARGGHVFATGGDGFAAAFGRADEAAKAALEAQDGLATQEWPEGITVRVRMALHTGAAEERGGNYFGPAVNRAARLVALGHGGQVLCSSVTAELLDGFDVVDLGEHRLRDLSGRQRVFQVGSGRFPPLRSIDAFPGNLPLQVSSFIGRDAELSRTAKALDEARAVTLTGVGGVGKTRLALQAAALALPRFRDGAWLVELAMVRDPAGVVNAVATTLDVIPRGGNRVEDALVEFLRRKQLLLVVDNAEHVLEEVAGLVGLLERSCPELVVLVTSREGLAIEGERVLPVPSLSAPPPGAPVEAAAAADAVRLFVERARAVDPDFELGKPNVSAVVEICRRLDGIPLAIELAAARVSAMTLHELAAGLDRRFATLAGGRRRAVQRHQTLRAAIDWSYELLTEAERRLLARLAVFAGGCTRSAAEQVCSGLSLSPGEVFAALASLVAKSLVDADREETETRYRLLETIREYGEERLAEAGETEAVRAAHAEYFCELTMRLHDRLYGPEQVKVARRLAADYDNLFTAMQYALDIGNADLALRLVSQQPPALLQVGYHFTLPVDAALGLADANTHHLYPAALVIGARLAVFHGDLERAEATAELAQAALRAQGDDPWVESEVLTVRAAVASARGAFAEAAGALAEGAELARRSDAIGSTLQTGFLLSSAAMAHTLAGNPEAGKPLAIEGVALAREAGSPSVIALTLAALAGTLAESAPDRARLALDEALNLVERLEVNAAPWATQGALIAARLGDWPLVLRLGLSALRHHQWTGDRAFLSGILNVVARAVASSDAEAAAVLQGAVRRSVLAGGTGSPSGQRMVDIAPSSFPHPAPDPSSFPTEVRRQTTAIIRDIIGDDPMRELRSAGEAMDLDDAVRYAIEVVQRNLVSTQPGLLHT